MAVWELVRDAMTRAHRRGVQWLTVGEIVREVHRMDPNVHPGTISCMVKAYCPNDPSKRNWPRLYRRNPLFVTDDPTKHGKSYRLLTEDERRVFLANVRDDLDQFTYARVLKLLRQPGEAVRRLPFRRGAIRGRPGGRSRGPRRRIGLIACTKAKLNRPAPARDLYSASDLFRKAVAYCDAHLDGWFVLSAKYGLVEPDRVLEPYDVTLKTMPSSERRRWGTHVAHQLRQLGDVALEAHAGAAYVQPLLEAGIVLDDPVQGLTIGKRKRWYIERLARTKLAYHSQP